MAQILLKEKYTRMVVQPDGGLYREEFWHFDTDTLLATKSMNEGVFYADPAPLDYSRPMAERFHFTCADLTETGYYHNGTGGFTPTTVANSVACGYTPPADGTFLRTECYGYDLYNVVADGNGGERQGELVEANNVGTCNYVPPVYGCMDPSAENYDASATADNGTCTYLPQTFTEVKVIEVLPCTEGVCLRWYNNLGGIDSWVFAGKVDKPFASEASGEFELSSGLKAAASKAGNPSMVLRTSGLNYNRYSALWQLYTSPKVWVHHPDNTTEEVYVQPASVAPMPLGRKSYDLVVELAKAPVNSLTH